MLDIRKQLVGNFLINNYSRNFGKFPGNIFNSDLSRGGSRTAATSKIELFVIIVNGFQPLTIIIKCSILDVAAVLDLALLRMQDTEIDFS